MKISIDNAKDAVAGVEASMERRSTSETHLNNRSSRSHCIVILQAQQATVDARKTVDEASKFRARASSSGDGSGSGSTTIGTLYLVDLAGSERIKQSGVVGEELEEARHINKSLSALGNVLTQLSDKTHRGLVSYRDRSVCVLCGCVCVCVCACLSVCLSVYVYYIY
jgi:kinesin family protein 4/21/27